MSRWMAWIYDAFMRETEEACLLGWRTEVLRHATGRVLEIGSGTGANLSCYGAGVDSLVLCEPDPHMRRRLVERARTTADSMPFETDVSDAVVDALPFESGRFDAVVSTLVLCSVPSQDRALAEIRRVLRPGGNLVFIEHVIAHDRPGRRRLQRAVEPVWKLVADNCHVTRDTRTAIEQAGFEIVECTHESMRKALPIVRPSIRGIARKPDA